MTEPPIVTLLFEAFRIYHDLDPDEWHREMLEPPRVRGEWCRFCGITWHDYQGSQP